MRLKTVIDNSSVGVKYWIMWLKIDTFGDLFKSRTIVTFAKWIRGLFEQILDISIIHLRVNFHIIYKNTVKHAEII